MTTLLQHYLGGRALEESLVGLYDGIMPCEPPLEQGPAQVEEAQIGEERYQPAARCLEVTLAPEVQRNSRAESILFLHKFSKFLHIDFIT